MDIPEDDYPFLDAGGGDKDSIGRIGSYRIHGVLGNGATSIVFKGWDEKLERWVAVRVLKSHLVKVPTARAHFLAENRAGSSVVHPNVLAVYEVHDHEVWPHAILAFNDGETLADLCESGHTFTLDEICQIGLGMAKGLDAIHEAGFVHGDLKPSNALIEHTTKVVRLTDFGAPAGQGATPLYRSPEQIDERPLDHRTDLFSLGVILYQITLGKPPYQHRRGEALAKEVTSEPPPTIPRSKAPAWLRQLITSLLAKDPNLRPSTAREVIGGFESQTYHGKPRKLPLLKLATALALTLATIAVVLGWDRFRPSQRTPVYLKGTSKGYANLAIAIAEAESGATIVLRDGLHELPGETTLFQPIRFVAEEGARPIIRSRDTHRGTLFQVKASSTFEGITLSHLMVEPSTSGPLIGGSGALTFLHCRLEHVWKGSPRVSPRQSVIRTYGPVTLRNTEIDATASVGISSRLDRDGQTGIVTIDECAIAAHTAFYLHTQGHPGAHDISLSKCHILAGYVCSMAEEMAATPHWKIEDSIIEAGTMMIAYQEEPMLDKVLNHLGWEGNDNLYRIDRFLHPVRAKGIPTNKRRSLEGWLSLCPNANEHTPREVVESVLQPEQPAAPKDIPSRMQKRASTTAWDLRIQNPDIQRRYPTLGGNMANVGPLAFN